jgi:hypothetical protein
MRVIATMALAAFVAACSTSPTRPPPAVASPAGSPSSDAARSDSLSAAATSAAATSAAATPAASAGAPPTTNTVDQTLIKRGYQPGLYEGKVYYCKSVLDSEHFRLTRCYTAEQIKAMDRATQGVVNHLLMPGTCQGWGCH